MKTRSRVGRLGGRLVPPATAVTAIVLGACVGNPFDTRDFIDWSPPPELVREIDAIRLEDRSLSTPVTVEEGTAELVELARRRAEAGAVETLSLEQVRGASLEHNLDLRVQLVNPTLSQLDVDAEEAKFEMVFTWSARHATTDSPTPTPGIAGSKTEFSGFGTGMRIPMRTGGNVNVNFPFSRFDTDNPASLSPVTYSSDLSFSLSQPLLRNAGNRVNTHSIRVVRRQAQIADARTKLEAIRILANADRAYWLLYAAQRELEVRLQQHELAMAQLERAERRVNAGAAPDIEIIRAQSGVAQGVEAIIVSENLIRRRERDLKRIMNRPDLPMDTPTALTLTTQPDPVGLELDPDTLAAFALENRMEMLELELQLAIDASTIDFRDNARLPLVTLDYTYNLNGLGLTYGRSFEQIRRRSFEDHTVGLAGEIPIGNEAAQARLHRAVLQRVQRLATREQRREAIRQEVFDAADLISQNWLRILAARQDALLQGETYEAERRQFEAGARTSTDVLDAATRLADAQSREIQALSDYQVAQIDLAFATGTLLGYNKVRWDPTPIEE